MIMSVEVAVSLPFLRPTRVRGFCRAKNEIAIIPSFDVQGAQS
jgi:hypothetical protein